MINKIPLRDSKHVCLVYQEQIHLVFIDFLDVLLQIFRVEKEWISMDI